MSEIMSKSDLEARIEDTKARIEEAKRNKMSVEHIQSLRADMLIDECKARAYRQREGQPCIGCGGKGFFEVIGHHPYDENRGCFLRLDCPICNTNKDEKVSDV